MRMARSFLYAIRVLPGPLSLSRLVLPLVVFWVHPPAAHALASNSGPPAGRVGPPATVEQAPPAPEPPPPPPPPPDTAPAAPPPTGAPPPVDAPPAGAPPSSPTPGEAPAPAAPAAPVRPVPPPPETTEPAPSAPAQKTPEPPAPLQPRLPTIQRPEERVEATPVPGRVVPALPRPDARIDLVYVPGFRVILSGHRDNYFVSGLTGEQHLIKFQYSVKFDLWPNASRHSAYFGFTQKSLWRLWDFSASSPFQESNYAPEVFYGYYMKLGDLIPQPGTTTGFLEFVRVGFEHESNGEDGTQSRSWNRPYATFRAGAYLGSDHYLAFSPRGWWPVLGDGDNETIEQFLGYGSLGIEYGYDPAIKRWYGGGNISVTGWKGWNFDWDKRGVEVAAQWRPAYEGRFVEWWKFTPYIYAQLFHGYGETLLQYNQKTTAFRIGISFEDRVNWVTLPKR
jgi:outer membrane phospholipase A